MSMTIEELSYQMDEDEIFEDYDDVLDKLEELRT